MRTNMQPVKPIMVIDLFPQERKQLLELFSVFEAKDWEKPTICPGWCVKDIGLHLLGDDIGYLSRARDHFSNPFFRNKDLDEWKSLVKNINEVNELWVKATARISPKLLIDLLALTGKQFYDYVVHQQQIRDAVNKPGLKEKRFFHPVLDTFVRALPHTYKDVPVANTTFLKFVVIGEAGDIWYLVGEANRWTLFEDVALQPDAVATMDQETCWRLFTKGMNKNQLRERTAIEGDQKLGEKLLETVSIIA